MRKNQFVVAGLLVAAVAISFSLGWLARGQSSFKLSIDGRSIALPSAARIEAPREFTVGKQTFKVPVLVWGPQS